MKKRLTPQDLKKIAKYGLLFVLGCILIYANMLTVKAYTVSNGSIYTCDLNNNVTTGTYNFVLEGASYTGRFGSTYQGVMSAFSTSFNAQIQQGNTYTLELYANTGDFRNININSIQEFGSLGSHCSSNLNAYTVTSVVSTYYKITITFVANSTANYSKLVIYNSNGDVITGISNFKIDSMALTDLGNSNTSDIINNQQQNTQDIIENDKQNTQDIIDNQDKNNEELKEEIKENFNNCYTNLFNANSYISNTFSSVSISNNNITATSTSSWKTLSYSFNVDPTKQYTLYYESSDDIAVYYYNHDASNYYLLKPSTFLTINLTKNTLDIRLQTKSDGTVHFNNLMLVEGITSIFIPYGQEVCSNKLDNISGGLNDLNDSITDDTEPDTSSLSDAAGWLPAGPVDSIANLPITFFQTLLSKLNKNCSPIELTLPFIDTELSLPCLSTIFVEIGFNSWWEGFGLIAGAWCVYKYLIQLYKWVDTALSMDEKEQLRKWGGV